MSTPVNTVYFHDVNSSVVSQLNQGPFTINPCNKLLEVTVKGVINLQSAVVTSPVTGNNVVVWAVYWVAHGAAIPNIVSASDSRQFLARSQLGDTDFFVTWSPSTADSVTYGGFSLDFTWRGQQLTGGGIDLYLGWATPFAGGIGNVTVNATMRARAV